ncbi:MAG: hypothetical protein F6K10_06430 [Moorea sp. SIO2B7]|nr:hypothetical protein [Moorena sp. SIO2B7]
MKSQQEQAYRNLISMVLTYPHQAALILDNHEKLLDSELMELMQQVATRMEENSSQEAADFLAHLVAQLKHEIKPSSKNCSWIGESKKLYKFQLFWSTIVILILGVGIFSSSSSSSSWGGSFLSDGLKVIQTKFEQQCK